jgi:hypothetical protein
MAEIPQKQLARPQRAPDRVPQVSYSVADIGDISPGLRALGQAVGGIERDLYIEEANEHFDNARMDTLLGWQEVQKNISGKAVNPDGSSKPTPSLEGIQGSYLDGIRERYAPRNATARRHWESWVKSQRDNWNADVTGAMLAKRAMDAEASIQTRQAGLLKITDWSTAKSEIDNIYDDRVRLNADSAALAEIEREGLIHSWKYKELKEFAQANPAKFREWASGFSGQEIPDYEMITQDDIEKIHGEANQVEAIKDDQMKRVFDAAERETVVKIHSAATPEEIYQIKNEILGNRLFDGPTIDKWIDEADRRIGKMTDGKDPTSEVVTAATTEYYKFLLGDKPNGVDADPRKALESAQKNSHLFTPEKNDQRIAKAYESINEPKETSDGSPELGLYRDTLEVLRRTEVGAQDNVKEKAKIEFKYNRLENDMIEWDIDNSDATPDQREKQFESMIIAPKGDVTKHWLRRLGSAVFRNPPPTFNTLAPVATIDIPTIKTQAEYDALEDGARYMDADGEPGVKGMRAQ